MPCQRIPGGFVCYPSVVKIRVPDSNRTFYFEPKWLSFVDRFGNPWKRNPMGYLGEIAQYVLDNMKGCPLGDHREAGVMFKGRYVQFKAERIA